MKKSIEQVRAELDELNKALSKKSHISDNVLIANGRNKGKKRPAHSEKLLGRERPEHSQKISGENNPMYGKISPNKGKEMLQISEKLKGKKKPAGFGEKISKARKGKIGTWAGKKRPTQSERMKTNNPGLEKTHIQRPCEHCGKMVNAPNYKRWHGDNCKHKK